MLTLTNHLRVFQSGVTMSAFINPAARALKQWLDGTLKDAEGKLVREGDHITNAAFGAKIGCSDAYVSMLKHGKNNPSRRMAKRIEEETEGAIPRDQWETETVVPEPAS
jgi:transcriptional regulator with XRE-family HTH domain